MPQGPLEHFGLTMHLPKCALTTPIDSTNQTRSCHLGKLRYVDSGVGDTVWRNDPDNSRTNSNKVLILPTRDSVGVY